MKPRSLLTEQKIRGKEVKTPSAKYVSKTWLRWLGPVWVESERYCLPGLSLLSPISLIPVCFLRKKKLRRNAISKNTEKMVLCLGIWKINKIVLHNNLFVYLFLWQFFWTTSSITSKMDRYAEWKHQRSSSSFSWGLTDISVKAINVYSYNTVVVLLSDEMWKVFELIPIPAFLGLPFMWPECSKIGSCNFSLL